MKRCLGKILAFVVLAEIVLSFPAAAGPGAGAVPVYPLTIFYPDGFSHYGGVLDLVPISASSVVAFAGNKDDTGAVTALSTFVLQGSGVASRGKLFGSGMGIIRSVAAIWNLYSGSGYGLVYVMFETRHTNPAWSGLSLRVAKFNAAGQRTTGWKEIWKASSLKGAYVPGLALSAYNRADVIGLAFSVDFAQVSTGRLDGGSAYFLEANLKTGLAAGPPVSLPVTGDGSRVYCTVNPLVWNGNCWLVPVSAYVYKSPFGWDDITSIETMMVTVGGDAAHGVVRVPLESTKDKTVAPGEMFFAPYPGSTTDRWLFMKKDKTIPEPQQRLEKYQYTFSLVRIDSAGQPVQTKTLSFGKLAHKLAFDPAYGVFYETDGFSQIAASGAPKLYLSRLHTLNLNKKGDATAAHRFEQQFLLYEIDARSGTVVCKNRAVTTWEEMEYERWPIIFTFLGGPLAVVNGLGSFMPPFSSLSAITQFAGLVE